MSLIFRLFAWFGLPAWVAPVALAVMATSLLGGAYIKGRMDSSASCREGELRAQIATMERDRKMAEQSAERAKNQVKRLEEAAKRDDEEIARYEEELRKRPDRCDITNDDVNRLRGGKGR
jgi:outer membrane murein-binding lipoprotein Lpp